MKMVSLYAGLSSRRTFLPITVLKTLSPKVFCKCLNVSRARFVRLSNKVIRTPSNCKSGLGRARILHLPGELFVEYQLAAKAARPDLFVALAAYGDYAPWYIGTAIAYEQGGYETCPNSSNVAPEVENVLMAAIRKLLRSPR